MEEGGQRTGWDMESRRGELERARNAGWVVVGTGSVGNWKKEEGGGEERISWVGLS